MANAIVGTIVSLNVQAETYREWAVRHGQPAWDTASPYVKQIKDYGYQGARFLGRHKGKIAAGVGTAALGAATYYAAPGIKERMRIMDIVKEAGETGYIVSRYANMINSYNKGRSIAEIAGKNEMPDWAIMEVFKLFKDTEAFTEEAKERLAGELSEYVSL